MPVRSSERRPLDIGRGRCRRERRQVVSAHLRHRLEARCQLDQCGLTEGRPKEADPKRNTVLRAIRWLRR